MDAVTTSIYLDTRRAKKDETYPVKLRITFQRKTRLYGTKYDLSKVDFKKVTILKPRNEYKTIAMELSELEKKANKAIQNIEAFSFEKFEKVFIKRGGKKLDVFIAYQEHIDELNEQGSLSTASTYVTARNSFKKYIKKDKLGFNEITADFLMKYEAWMKSKGMSVTTVSINTRTMRKLFNKHIDTGEINSTIYPFGKNASKYQPPQHNNVKKALKISDIKKIFEYESSNETERFCRDIWLFSYFCSGMNMADIARLKYKDVSKDMIVFIRTKTAHNRKLKPIVVAISDHISKIINEYGNKPKKADAYVFNILSEGLNAQMMLSKIKSFTKLVNTHIKIIAYNVGIQENISTYTARHSYATITRNSGASIEFISERLGHNNVVTTNNYLAKFDDEEIKKYSDKLTDWD